MERAPIVVHRVGPSGGRRVGIRVSGVDTILGVAHGDTDVIEMLRRIEVPDPDELVLGDSPLIEWQFDGPHVYEAETGPPPADLP
ncbi:hypothetical protein ACFWBH_02230 [Streptomyces sp. NPDC059999]|uniref:hypothetical protein n=1 Tax=Streptomyces sp. NPDC059999 TaxID=3347030 RepID=UPI003679B473